jgi:SAM-dependent methyltransferase
VLDATDVGPRLRVLDVGCGSGLALVLAAGRGAEVAGADITPGLLAIARERLPDAELREADMEALPFADAAFDVVLGVNSFQFAADPLRALREAARVCRPGGRVAASLFAEPERSESSVVQRAMAALSRPGEHAPFMLSAPGNLEEAMRDAGLKPADRGEVECTWSFGGMEDAVRALLASAGGASAVMNAGEAAVRKALLVALLPFQDSASGVVSIRNTFRWVVATRP